MNLDFDRVMTFIIMWGIPIFMVLRTYLKMDNDEKTSAKNDFKKPRFIFTIGFVVIGLFLSQLGSIVSIKLINLIGIIMLVIGGILSTFDIWKSSKIKSMFVLILIIISIFFLYK